MKPIEYLKTLRGKSAKELAEEVAALRKEQFNLRMQAATGQENKSHLTRNARKNIARAKTVMSQQVKAK